MTFVKGNRVVGPEAPGVPYIVLEVDDRVTPPLMRVARQDKKPIRISWLSQEGWSVVGAPDPAP